jgi:hypothetical protein
MQLLIALLVLRSEVPVEDPEPGSEQGSYAGTDTGRYRVICEMRSYEAESFSSSRLGKSRRSKSARPSVFRQRTEMWRSVNLWISKIGCKVARLQSA